EQLREDGGEGGLVGFRVGLRGSDDDAARFGERLDEVAAERGRHYENLFATVEVGEQLAELGGGQVRARQVPPALLAVVMGVAEVTARDQRVSLPRRGRRLDRRRGRLREARGQEQRGEGLRHFTYPRGERFPGRPPPGGRGRATCLHCLRPCPDRCDKDAAD